MSRYTDPATVKIVIAYAEAAECYGWPRPILRHNPRGIPCATRNGNVERRALPEPPAFEYGGLYESVYFDLLARNPLMVAGFAPPRLKS
jgi:hypothetical protein